MPTVVRTSNMDRFEEKLDEAVRKVCFPHDRFVDKWQMQEQSGDRGDKEPMP